MGRRAGLPGARAVAGRRGLRAPRLRQGRLGGRVKALSKAAVYLALAWTTFGFARGKRSNSKQQTVDFTASLMDKPGGRWLVGLVGLVIIGVGGYHVCKGATEGFLRDLDESPGDWATRAGRVGYIAKGVALAIVGRCSSPPACTAAPGAARPRRRAAHPARAALRPGAAHPGGRRPRGLRPVQLRPRPARPGLTRSAGPGPTRAGTRADPAYRRRHAEGRRGHLSALLLGHARGAARRPRLGAGWGALAAVLVDLAQELLELGADLVGRGQLADVGGQQAGLLRPSMNVSYWRSRASTTG